MLPALFSNSRDKRNHPSKFKRLAGGAESFFKLVAHSGIRLVARDDLWLCVIRITATMIPYISTQLTLSLRQVEPRSDLIPKCLI